MSDTYAALGLIIVSAGLLGAVLSLTSRPPGWRLGAIWAALIAAGFLVVVKFDSDDGLLLPGFILTMIALCFARLGWHLSQSRWSPAIWLLTLLAGVTAWGFALMEIAPSRGFMSNLGYAIGIALTGAATAGTIGGLALTWWRGRRAAR